MMTRRQALIHMLTAKSLCGVFPSMLSANDSTRVFRDGEKPDDARLGPPITLNGYFPFRVPTTLQAWEVRRQRLREQVLVATGLWPMPEKTPLNAVIHGRMDRDGYSIEKVYFASLPGHYVTGNLYRPRGSETARKSPAVLFAHGHWRDGRFHDAGERAAQASVDNGGESDLLRGRYFMQAIPVTLARMGFIVFQYDMVGYADSTALVHREGFKDLEAELRLQSFMGLQTWNSIRALDFLLSLPEVDGHRVGMTGASGGGTQTFILAAIDDRLAAAFPAVMVSTAMQGGCVCENCSYLRIDTGNVELAALFAPRPLAMSAANDWTKEIMTKGFPELQQLYELYGRRENVAAKAWLEYGHNYNQKAREFMYSWFSRHLLGKGAEPEPKEAPFEPIVPPNRLSVYDPDHPRPQDELNAEALRQELTRASNEQLARMFPDSPERLADFRKIVGTALRVMVNPEWPTPPLPWATSRENRVTIDGLTVIKRVIAWPGRKEAIPLIEVIPDSRKEASEAVVLWLHPAGKRSVFPDDRLVPSLRRVLDKGYHIVAPDLLGTGELLIHSPQVDKNYAGFTFGYNRPLLANQVRDTLTALAYVNHLGLKTVRVVGWGGLGPVAILAKALAGDAINRLAADANHFRFENLRQSTDPMMLPGALKYGGMDAFVALCAPGEVLVHAARDSGIGKFTRAAYKTLAADNHLTIHLEKFDADQVLNWLMI